MIEGGGPGSSSQVTHVGRDEFPQQKSVTSLLFSSLVKCKQKEGGGGGLSFLLVGWLVGGF